jgi:hypothetical protein
MPKSLTHSRLNSPANGGATTEVLQPSSSAATRGLVVQKKVQRAKAKIVKPRSATDWWDDPTTAEEDEQEDVIREYDISSNPNDFNIITIMSFLESGNVKIPAFQRNYVWDIKRASKLIESIVIGLPIPQIFLFEESRNKFLVIDGQQRLTSIYYFIKRRFPQKHRRVDLRRIFDQHGSLPESVLYDDDYFCDFNLRLSDRIPNPLHGLNYARLGGLKSQFDLRTIRNVIIKQNHPAEDDSSIYEIFNRLNSGGMNLGPQEIRGSLYHSEFYTMLARVNADPRWRMIIGLDDPDLHMKDIETILRGFALLMYGREYQPSMTRFLNDSSRKLQKLSPDAVRYLESLFMSFLDACAKLPPKAFYGKMGAFTISIFDAVFAAVCKSALNRKAVLDTPVDWAALSALKQDAEFVGASQSRTAGQGNVLKRLERAEALLQ